MRFKVDENLPAEVAEVLRSAGHDARTVQDEGLAAAEDDNLLATCRGEGRVLMTLDLDFADMQAYPPTENPGLIVFRVRSQDKNHLLDLIERAVPLLSREPVEKHLWIVEENRVRIRGAETS